MAKLSNPPGFKIFLQAPTIVVVNFFLFFCQIQLLRFPDGMSDIFKRDISRTKRKRFKPAVRVHNAIVEDASCTQSVEVKRRV